MPASDYRVSVGFWDHFKTKKLIRRLGLEAVVSLQRLWEFCARSKGKSQGNLCGMDPEDIEIVVEWDGDGSWVETVIEIGFLDRIDLCKICGESCYAVHDFFEENHWVYEADKRSEQARKANKLSQKARKNKRKAPNRKKKSSTHSNSESVTAQCEISDHSISDTASTETQIEQVPLTYPNLSQPSPTSPNKTEQPRSESVSLPDAGVVDNDEKKSSEEKPPPRRKQYTVEDDFWDEEIREMEKFKAKMREKDARRGTEPVKLSGGKIVENKKKEPSWKPGSPVASTSDFEEYLDSAGINAQFSAKDRERIFNLTSGSPVHEHELARALEVVRQRDPSRPVPYLLSCVELARAEKKKAEDEAERLKQKALEDFERRMAEQEAEEAEEVKSG